MDVLTGRYRAVLVPSSQSPGNTISDGSAWAMTAPGSPSINPLPDRRDQLPQPVLPDGQIPVNYPPRLGEVAHPHDGGFDAGTWRDVDNSGGTWVQT
jgi:hypothetical protein